MWPTPTTPVRKGEDEPLLFTDDHGLRLGKEKETTDFH
jgi:hypothetical protein